jgi:hypothetical protein
MFLNVWRTPFGTHTSVKRGAIDARSPICHALLSIEVEGGWARRLHLDCGRGGCGGIGAGSLGVRGYGCARVVLLGA